MGFVTNINLLRRYLLPFLTAAVTVWPLTLVYLNGVANFLFNPSTEYR